MYEVEWQAQPHKPKQRLALKVLHKRQHDKSRDLFLREAQAQHSAIGSQNIVRCLGIIQLGTATPGLADDAGELGMLLELSEVSLRYYPAPLGQLAVRFPRTGGACSGWCT